MNLGSDLPWYAPQLKSFMDRVIPTPLVIVLVQPGAGTDVVIGPLADHIFVFFFSPTTLPYKKGGL